MLKSKTGYSCPNCESICLNETKQSQTTPEFREEPDPHYAWIETHICQNCETEYQISNGT